MSDQSVRLVKKVPGKKGNTKKRTCLLVLGMHRSGTSALTRLLNFAGAALPANLFGANKTNKVGHWESNLLIEYHDQFLKEFDSSWCDWRAFEYNHLGAEKNREIKAEIGSILDKEYFDEPLFVVKDPRICRFAPLFVEALNEADIEVHFLLLFRNPLEVCESLKRRDSMSRSDAALLWLRHVLDTEQATRLNARTIVSYEALLSDWKGTLETLSKQSNIKSFYSADEIETQISQFIQPKMRHHTRTIEDVLLDPLLKDWTGSTYEALLDLEHNPGSEKALATLDAVALEFNNACPIIHHFAQGKEILSRALQSEKRRAKDLQNQLASSHDQIKAQLALIEEWRYAYENSTSWRITLPLRMLKRLFAPPRP